MVLVALVLDQRAEHDVVTAFAELREAKADISAPWPTVCGACHHDRSPVMDLTTMVDDDSDRATEAVLRHDLEDAIRNIARVRALYLDILEDLVRGYVTALRRRHVTRAKAQQQLADLIAQATDDPSSSLILYSARWVGDMYPSTESTSSAGRQSR